MCQAASFLACSCLFMLFYAFLCFFCLFVLSWKDSRQRETGSILDKVCLNSSAQSFFASTTTGRHGNVESWAVPLSTPKNTRRQKHKKAEKARKGRKKHKNAQNCTTLPAHCSSPVLPFSAILCICRWLSQGERGSILGGIRPHWIAD